MPRPIYVEINLNAVRSNIKTISSTASSSRLWAVIKSNAYGHGIQRIYPALSQCHGLSLIDFSDAAQLREQGETKPIIMLEGFYTTSDLMLCHQLKLMPVIHHEEQYNMLRKASFSQPLEIIVKLNSGMNRLGFKHASPCLQRLLSPLVGDPWKTLAIMTHFYNADAHYANGIESINYQMNQMNQLLKQLILPSHMLYSYANSAAIIRHFR